VLVRILLVDDSRQFLEAARRFLARESLDVVGQALSGYEALEQVTRLHPDLVLMDIAMPQMNGLEATRHIKAQPDPPRVIVLTLHDNSAYAAEALTAGADGFIAKADFGVRLIPAIVALFAAENFQAGRVAV
jgi:DNA-binding NarL/FixJ family response regulator